MCHPIFVSIFCILSFIILLFSCVLVYIVVYFVKLHRLFCNVLS